jgi:methanogenic corrinoid protein MtbC1
MGTLDELYRAIVDLDEERALELARRAISQDQTTPLLMLSTCQQALRMVGERYERGKYFLTALVLAGELFKEVLELMPGIHESAMHGPTQGKVLLGTVQADIHNIGKDVFGTALRSYGFEVIDLGVDVPKERFLDEVRRSRPDVVCLSGLILAAFESMKSTTRLIRAHDKELAYRPPVVIGGGTVDGQICSYVGADSWSTDAMEGVRICQELLKAKTD